MQHFSASVLGVAVTMRLLKQHGRIMSNHWVTEQYLPSGSAIGLRIHSRLHAETTHYQTIEIYDTTDWGHLMLIDGCMMVSDRDNFFYHEMMTHPALFTHPTPRHVAIIGGGDCGSLREVLRHPQISGVVQIEIDERVTRLAEEFFPSLCEANADPRAELLFADGIAWMRDTEAASLDVIIVDSTDPVGPAEGLFNEVFYRSCYAALSPGGILVQQSESPLAHIALIKTIHATMRQAGFGARVTLPFPQPCYPTGWWSCTLARKGDASLDQFREADASTRTFATQYYNPAIHHAALAQPEFLRRALQDHK